MSCRRGANRTYLSLFFNEGMQMKWEEYSNLMLDKCRYKNKPFFACFELTPFCNFKCNMCYVRLDSDQALAQGGMLSTEQWIRVADEAKRMGVILLEITGGEPTTRPDFKELYTTLIKMGFVIRLRTNAYLINGDTLELLKKYKPYQISITLYGSSDEIYKRICHVNNGFSIVSNNILAMQEAGLNIRLTTTMTKDNIDDIKNMKAWAADNDLKLTPFGGLITPVRNANRSIDHLRIKYTDEECEIFEDLQARMHKVDDRTRYMNPFWMCRGFGAEFCISWDGRMTLCNGLTSIWQEALSQSLSSAFHKLYDELRRVKRPAECGSCRYIEYCGACPSQLLSATSNCEKTCEDICRVARRNCRCYLLNETNKENDVDLLCE